MIEIYKYPLDCFYTVTAFDAHEVLKPKLLDLISQEGPDSIESVDDYYSDRVSKLDWNKCHDYSRPWVRELQPSLQPVIDCIAFSNGYKTAVITEIWFQQYISGNMHGWHVHGSNFTGVYYLELEESSPKTQLLDPLTQKNLITPDIREGDILIFPSFAIHRAPIIHNDVRKTIVSFNMNFEWINDSVLKGNV